MGSMREINVGYRLQKEIETADGVLVFCARDYSPKHNIHCDGGGLLSSSCYLVCRCGLYSLGTSISE